MKYKSSIQGKKVGFHPILLSLILVFVLSGQIAAKSYTGVYFSFLSNQLSRSYTDSSVSETPFSYSKSMLSLFGSLYGSNSFEINFVFTSDKYYMENDDTFISRYLIALEGGKVFSFNLSNNENPFASSDFSVGAFYRLNFLGPSSAKKISGEYGLYSQIKLKINLHEKFLKLSSFDIGYKLILPLNFNYYPSDGSIITATHSFFMGVSF